MSKIKQVLTWQFLYMCVIVMMTGGDAMNFEDKFNKIIDLVEVNLALSKEDIQNAVAQGLCENGRTIADVFKFISGMTLKQYVVIRKCIKGLYLVHKQGYTLEEIAISVGYADASSFSKAFKGIYGVSPKLIAKDKIEEIIGVPPLYFSNIINGEKDKYMRVDDRVTQNVFGISVEKYNMIKKVFDLGALHGFTDEQSQFAYKLSEDTEIELTEAFDFVDDLLLQIEDASFYGQVDLLTLARLSVQNNLSVFETLTVIKDLKKQGIENLNELSDEFWQIYINSENKPYDFDAQTALDVAELMVEKGISMSEFDDVLMFMGIYDEDVFEIVCNFRKYEKDYDDMIFSDFDFGN